MSASPSGDHPAVVDNFTILRRLGAGAMGEVFLARESITERSVALKLMAEHLTGKTEHVKRFEREIHVISQLEHPNIAGYAGHGVWNGRPYLASEFIPGSTLADFIRGGRRVDEEVALAVAAQVAVGLRYAQHRCELVHRDIKPGNLLAMCGANAALTTATTIKVIDFGLARARAAHDSLEYDLGGVGAPQIGNAMIDAGEQFQTIDQSDLDAAGANGLTMAGQVVGTPYYMAPEQCQGAADITFHADLYALGATLFHLLTGRAPYAGRTPGMLLVSHLSEPVPDPGQVIRTLQPATRDLVMRAMAKKPSQRHSTYDHFIQAAQAAANSLRQTRIRAQAQPQTTSQIRRTTQDVAKVLDEVSQPGAKPLTGADALREVTTRFLRKAPPGQPVTGVFRKPDQGGNPPGSSIFRRPG